jgi:hypothetical protein
MNPDSESTARKVACSSGPHAQEHLDPDAGKRGEECVADDWIVRTRKLRAGGMNEVREPDVCDIGFVTPPDGNRARLHVRALDESDRDPRSG